MSDKLKSAYELAMEKLTRKDKESTPGSAAREKLTAEQKEKIAEIRREIRGETWLNWRSFSNPSVGQPEATLSGRRRSRRPTAATGSESCPAKRNGSTK